MSYAWRNRNLIGQQMRTTEVARRLSS